MAIHLGALIQKARIEPDPESPEHVEIVELILRIWSRRFRMPGGGPTAAYALVLAGLERLGDETPWRFSRLSSVIGEADVSSLSGSGLLDAAASLEQLTRRTMIRLFWLASQEANEGSKDVIALADKVKENVESHASATLDRLVISARRRRLEPRAVLDEEETVSDSLAEADHLADTPDEPFEPESEDAEASPEIEPLDESPLSLANNVAELRRMAALLTSLADDLEAAPKGQDAK